jgi:hypothetical protein
MYRRSLSGNREISVLVQGCANPWVCIGEAERS